MQLASLINSALPQRPDEIAGALRAWSKGQMLDATVLRANGGQALLQVNGQQVLAQARMPLVVGQALRLQVDQAGTQPQLRVIDGPQTGAVLQTLNQAATAARATVTAPQPQGAVAVSQTDALAAAVLRRALPDRQPMPQSLQVLAQFVAAPRPARSHPALEQVRAMVADLLQGLPRPRDAADANALRAMVQRSGLFHEAELAKHAGDADPSRVAGRQHLFNPPAADMKARLTAVAETLAGAMRGAASADEGAEHAAAALRGALANIEVNQVASVRGSDQGLAQNAVWRVDLPFAEGNGHQALQLRIDREARGGADEIEPSWVAQLVIEPPGQAPLHVRIALNASTVYTTFSTADEAVATRIEENEPALRGLLDAVDLDLGAMRCQRGDFALGTEEALPDAALVSEHA